MKLELRAVLLPLIDSYVIDAQRAEVGEKLLGTPQPSADEAVATLLWSGDPWLRSRAEFALQRSIE